MKPTHIEEAMATRHFFGPNPQSADVCLLIAPDDRIRTKIVDTRVRFRYINRAELESSARPR